VTCLELSLPRKRENWLKPLSRLDLSRRGLLQKLWDAYEEALRDGIGDGEN